MNSCNILKMNSCKAKSLHIKTVCKTTRVTTTVNSNKKKF